MDVKIFEAMYGCAAPVDLIELCKMRCPVRFELDDRLVVEVQYFLSIERQAAINIEKTFYAFAVSTDGHDLLIDLRDENLLILQDEHGHIETIGVTLGRLLQAKACNL
jgi:hypothetical protein